VDCTAYRSQLNRVIIAVTIAVWWTAIVTSIAAITAPRHNCRRHRDTARGGGRTCFTWRPREAIVGVFSYGSSLSLSPMGLLLYCRRWAFSRVVADGSSLVLSPMGLLLYCRRLAFSRVVAGGSSSVSSPVGLLSRCRRGVFSCIVADRSSSVLSPVGPFSRCRRQRTPSTQERGPSPVGELSSATCRRWLSGQGLSH
jgi:hypothetical protein